MNNQNTVSYDDSWKEVSTPIYINDLQDDINSNIDKKQKKVKKKSSNKLILLVFQLVISIIILLSSLIIKTIGGELYSELHDWYFNQYNNEIILSDEISDFNIKDILNNEN